MEMLCSVRLLLTAVFICCLTAAGRKSRSCTGSHNLVRYRVTFRAAWLDRTFPKQYPKFRPHAHWSKLVGRSHDESYELWTQGAIADPGFKEFAQEGKTHILDKRETQGFNGIFDCFTAPPVAAGEGETAADFFLTHNFSKVSVAVKIIPSPDWFVGVDSLNLCENGSWKEAVTVALDPMDAGTDRGFTFTSPNWASRPQEKIYQITNTFPDHRANSFYYPEIRKLPHIGHIEFNLLSQFRHEITHRVVSHRREVEEEDLEALERKREALEEKLILAGEPIGRTNQNDRNTNRQVSDESEESEVQQELTQPQPAAIDCIVGDWGAWSPCSKTCGFGAQKRHRKVVQVPIGGRSCSVLDQEKWCGSMRSCRVSGATSLFTWLDKKPKQKRTRRVFRRRQ